MDNQKVVILDADDTLLGLHVPLCAALNEFTGKSISCNEWGTFNVTDIYDGLHIEDFYKLIIGKELLILAEPYENTKNTLNTLKQLGYYIVIISSRGYHDNGYDVTKRWFETHNIPFDKIHISGNGIKKSMYSMMYDNVIMSVDDNIENCEDFSKNGCINNVVLMDQPWNRNNNEFKRIHSIEEILDLI
jgi:uncharacterized HAD superfamily protein